MEKVEILLSTYNGEKYLLPLLDSVYHQEEVEVHVWARDDGSTDSTLRLLQQQVEDGHPLSYEAGTENLRSARSFMTLLQTAPKADAYAFADQDDMWLPTKLKAATHFLKLHREQPALYFCQTKLVDKDLKPLEHQIIIHPYLTFGEALMYQFIGGCTMVMNEPLRQIVNQYTPQYLPMHDIWIYLIAQAIGAAIHFDSTPYLLYRQHDANVVGQGYGWQKSLMVHYKRLIVNKEHSRSRLAQEVLNGYRNLMSPNNIELAQWVSQAPQCWSARWNLLQSNQMKCANQRTQLLFKLSVLTGNI